MNEQIENWKVQIRKGYLELCVLLLIEQNGKIYGFDLIEKLTALELPIKEGTLYPLLNRMTIDGILSAVWDTENPKGHPRKFYSLTRDGRKNLKDMADEYDRMTDLVKRIGSLSPSQIIKLSTRK